MRVTFEPTSEIADAGQSSAFAQAEYRRLRHETQERDRGDALGAVNWLSERVMLVGLAGCSLIAGVCLGVLLS